MNVFDTRCLERALELAEAGRPLAHPNPYVGAVVARGEEILGEGWHARCGEAHAEVNALADAARRAPGCARGADLYVSLEPCCHHGRTPPCTGAIIAAGIARVVYILDDPNPQVAGKGRSALESAGIRVERGGDEERAREQNRAYLHFRATGLPYVTWKTAQTTDGRIVLVPGKRSNISGPESNRHVDRLRASTDAVLIGIGTALVDDPGLRVRTGGGVDPWRVVFDSRLRLPLETKLVSANADRRTIVVTASRDEARAARLRDRGVEVIPVAAAGERIDLRAAMTTLAARGLIEILMESGRVLGDAMVAAGLVRRLLVLQSGITRDERVRGRLLSAGRLGDDACLEFTLESRS